ncbi:unnamed protein product, partial [Ectocarpus fasciculatus]
RYTKRFQLTTRHHRATSSSSLASASEDRVFAWVISPLGCKETKNATKPWTTLGTTRPWGCEHHARDHPRSTWSEELPPSTTTATTAAVLEARSSCSNFRQASRSFASIPSGGRFRSTHGQRSGAPRSSVPRGVGC